MVVWKAIVKSAIKIFWFKEHLDISTKKFIFDDRQLYASKFSTLLIGRHHIHICIIGKHFQCKKNIYKFQQMLLKIFASVNRKTDFDYYIRFMNVIKQRKQYFSPLKHFVVEKLACGDKYFIFRTFEPVIFHCGKKM